MDKSITILVCLCVYLRIMTRQTLPSMGMRLKLYTPALDKDIEVLTGSRGRKNYAERR